MKYKRKNKYVITTEDGKYSIVKNSDGRTYNIRILNGNGYWDGEFLIDSDGDIATFFWQRTAKEYIENNFYKEVK